ncbi:hypothetical protein [Streptomyces sp. NBC_00572]|uniref:hypothetical protein n=1 Tax=Streptomyces sp. NBC_00572 TaxID=2903664 RepID=UPI002253BEAD|nr:hypothetical protein [Streptomyces sp. NBC_00572]MCX4982812.1 hypothetical protein [Streptomyces sp. NBC_00572]
MAEVTTEDLSIQIGSLRHYLTKVDHNSLPTTEWMKQQLAPVNKLIEDLKAEQEKVAEEVVKAPWEQVLEQLGLGSVAEIIKKFSEEGIMAAVGAAFVALGGMIVPILLTALGAFIVFQLQKWHAGRSATNETFGPRADGSFGRRNFSEIEAERNGVAPGGMADIPADANFDELRGQLERLNPHLAKFNLHAPSFVSNFRKMPTKGAAAKADVVEKIALAVKEVDHQNMALVASGMGKINGAVKNANPRKTSSFAKAIGKLKLAMDGLEVDKVPKAGTLGQAADNAKRLADNTGTLAQKMRDFAATVRSINDELGATA